MENINERIKSARKKAKLTQDQAAIKLNTTRSTISKYETGTLEPNLQILKEMIKLYKTTADYIFDIKNKTEKELTEEEQELINEWRELNDINKNAIRTTIKAFIENENLKEEKKSVI